MSAIARNFAKNSGTFGKLVDQGLKRGDIVRVRHSGGKTYSETCYVIDYVAPDGFACLAREMLDDGRLCAAQRSDTSLFVRVDRVPRNARYI